MFVAYFALHMVVLCVVVEAESIDASRYQSYCANLASTYAARYKLAFEKGITATSGTSFRPLKIQGRPTQLVVWGEKSGPPAAAAVLLYVVLRYGLGYNATLRLEPFSVCDADGTQFLVSPAVYEAPCHSDGKRSRILEMITNESLACVPLSGPLLARSSPECTLEGPVLPAENLTKLRTCASSLTLLRFRNLKEKLPSCNIEDRSTIDEDLSAYVVLAAADTSAASYEIDEVQKYISKKHLPLRFIRFLNTSCFHQTIMYLEKADITFLFIDKDLRMYKPELLSVLLKINASSGCISRDLNEVTERVHRVGDGIMPRKYAPQIADVVKKFQPSLNDLKEILDDQTGNDISIENVCKWVSQHNETFKSWVTNNKYVYKMYFFICTEDALYNEYIKVIELFKYEQATMKYDDFDISVYPVNHLDCSNYTNMTDTFSEFIQESLRKEIGIIAWSSSEGIKVIAREANAERVPLILAGPITPDTPIGTASNAINGRLDDLAFFYRAFLNNCGWTRFAIISDTSTYAKAFTNCLLHGYNYNYIEIVVTSGTVLKNLTSLREDDARIFIVNTDSSMATEILQAAVTLGMKPPQFGWILREWSPTKSMASEMASWDDMSHFSLVTAWRGTSGGAVEDNVTKGDAALRARLQSLWPDAAWPTLAAPLADAILLLSSSFNKFQQLYSTNFYNMRHGKYALNFSQIYDTLNLSGVDRELTFTNGRVETVIVYLEQWRGAARTVLGSWNMHDQGNLIMNQALCGARIHDRPLCSFPAGGKGFIQRCYDIPLYSLLVALVLLPIIFEAARRARFKRLAVRDLNLLAHILDKKQPIFHGHSLCVHRKIGMGNFGSVYLATVRQTKDKVMSVAAKELRDESDKEEYLQEAGILQQLDHENIVKFVGICVSNGSLFILMEYAYHGDLLQYLRTRRPMALAATCKYEVPSESQVSARTLTRMAREAACALSYLAHCGLVHRDVRAANCLVDARHTLKLADFGLARKLHDDLEYTSVRRTMLPVLWMAPESLSRGMFSPASDVWALGVLLLELVTLGERPYGTCAPLHVLNHVRLGGYPPIPPDATPQMVSLVMACWKHRAVERPTAGEVERYLTRESLALRPTHLPAPDIALPPALPDPLLPKIVAPQT